MINTGYCLVRLSDNTVSKTWATSDVPGWISSPDGTISVSCPTVGGIYGGYSLVQKVTDDNVIPPWHVKTGEIMTFSFDGTQLIVSPVTQQISVSSRITSMCDSVNDLRETKINQNFVFGGIVYQNDPDSRENISGAAQLASLAIAAGVQAGNLRWADPDHDFKWIAFDNSQTSMDAFTVLSFAKAAALRKMGLIMFASGLKTTIRSMTTHEQLDAIDITAGWPV